jgi:predicted nucleic acid-binding protein
VIFDTDVLIWFYRGNTRARQLVEATLPFKVSAVTYMELLAGIRNKEELRRLKSDFESWGIEVLPIGEEVSEKAVRQMEQYKLSHNLEMPDSLIAATAIEERDALVTGNIKHYGYLPGLKTIAFMPQPPQK